MGRRGRDAVSEAQRGQGGGAHRAGGRAAQHCRRAQGRAEPQRGVTHDESIGEPKGSAPAKAPPHTQRRGRAQPAGFCLHAGARCGADEITESGDYFSTVDDLRGTMCRGRGARGRGGRALARRGRCRWSGPANCVPMFHPKRLFARPWIYGRTQFVSLTPQSITVAAALPAPSLAAALCSSHASPVKYPLGTTGILVTFASWNFPRTLSLISVPNFALLCDVAT